MRHLERKENGRAMKARVARGLAPLAPCTRCRSKRIFGPAWRRGSACCRTLPKSRFLGFAGWRGSITTVDNVS